jgi:ATP-dependent RNA helicase RhlB
MKLLLGVLNRERPESAIIFCNTKRYTEIVAKRLRLNGYECEYIIGDLPQSRRLKVIDDVKAGKTKILVATDVAARGLDIEALSMVINYDLPVEAENYVHRIGRTARAGKTGKAFTLASEQDVYELPAIERYIGKKIPSEVALPELHAEDKSAGRQIHSEFYEDRHSEGRGHPHQDKGKGHHHGGKREDRRIDSGRGGKKNVRQENEAKSSAHKNNAHKSGVHKSNVHTSNTHKNSVHKSSTHKSSVAGGKKFRKDSTHDLSRMSFDERMALYKQKYDTLAPAAASAKTNEKNIPPAVPG